MDPSNDDNNNDNENNSTTLNALRIQTDNLALSASTPTRVSSFRSYSSINGGSLTSSPILTPSGSTLNLPSTKLTPLPSPLVTSGQFPSNATQFPTSLSLDTLPFGSSPRRKGYGSLGLGLPNTADNDKRNVTEFPAPRDGESGHERSVSMSRTATDEGLRREEIMLRRQRTYSMDLELYVSLPFPPTRIKLTPQNLDYWRTEDDEWIYSPTEYLKTKSLGRGTFSKVILATPLDSLDDTNNASAELLAIKVVNLDATDDAPASRITSSAKRELEILKKINHPCITRLLAYTELPEKCLFGLHYSRGGDLFDFASRQRPLLTPAFVKTVFRELVLAVQYLHETMYVVHRDLKLESMDPRTCLCGWETNE